MAKLRRRGDVICGYEVEDVLGQGNYGVVYRARKDGKSYALKLSLPTVGGGGKSYALKLSLPTVGGGGGGDSGSSGGDDSSSGSGRNESKTERKSRGRRRRETKARASVPREIDAGELMEAVIYRAIHHPNILRAVEVGFSCDDPSALLLVLEVGVPLTRWLSRHPLDYRTSLARSAPQRLTVAQIVRIAQGADCGKRELARNGIVHFDLKPDNILVATEPPGGTSGSTASSSSTNVSPSPPPSSVSSAALPSDEAATQRAAVDATVGKIFDLGLAQKWSRTGMERFAFSGSPAYMAPEELAFVTGERQQSYAVDTWALGVTLFEALFGRLPFDVPDYEYDGDDPDGYESMQLMKAIVAAKGLPSRAWVRRYAVAGSETRAYLDAEYELQQAQLRRERARRERKQSGTATRGGAGDGAAASRGRITRSWLEAGEGDEEEEEVYDHDGASDTESSSSSSSGDGSSNDEDDGGSGSDDDDDNVEAGDIRVKTREALDLADMQTALQHWFSPTEITRYRTFFGVDFFAALFRVIEGALRWRPTARATDFSRIADSARSAGVVFATLRCVTSLQAPRYEGADVATVRADPSDPTAPPAALLHAKPLVPDDVYRDMLKLWHRLRCLGFFAKTPATAGDVLAIASIASKLVNTTEFRRPLERATRTAAARRRQIVEISRREREFLAAIDLDALGPIPAKCAAAAEAETEARAPVPPSSPSSSRGGGGRGLGAGGGRGGGDDVSTSASLSAVQPRSGSRRVSGGAVPPPALSSPRSSARVQPIGSTAAPRVPSSGVAARRTRTAPATRAPTPTALLRSTASPPASGRVLRPRKPVYEDED